MQHRNMQQFIRELESAGELHRISAKVDAKLEITEIVDRISKASGPALLFENVSGSAFPVLINAFGSYRRMQMALSCDSFDDIGMRLEEKMKIQPPRSLKEKLQALITLKEISNIIPKKVKRAPCQEQVYGPDGPLLDMLPILTCWPHDGGPFITLPVVITKDPDTGIQNMGMYRMHKYDNTTTGMHCQNPPPKNN